MDNKQLARQIKKLIYSNRFTMETISQMIDVPVDECMNLYFEYYKQPLPPSLMIVGNEKARDILKKNIKNAKPTLICGPNGTGKDISLREIAKSLSLDLRKIVPLKEKELALHFGRGPLFNNNNSLFVIDIDSLSKKKYSILLKYIKESVRPIILMTQDKDNVNKKILKKLSIVKFSHPTSLEVEKFLKIKYGWEGDIRDVYDNDMRVVISRVLASKKLDHIKIDEEIKSSVLAFNISCGYTKYEDFDKLKEPFWWVLRWLTFNQHKKHKNQDELLSNLRKLSIIDSYKFLYNEEYLRQMLLDLNTSPVRTQFSFPPWGKKKEIKEEDLVEKLSSPSEIRKKEVEKKLEKVDWGKWL